MYYDRGNSQGRLCVEDALAFDDMKQARYCIIRRVFIALVGRLFESHLKWYGHF